MDKLAVIKPQQKLILQKVKGLPPLGWRTHDCHTPAQKSHWRDCRRFFRFLSSMLEDYFSGEATDLSRFSKKDQKFWFRYRDFWLQVYSLISENWVEIRQEPRALGIEVKKTELPKNPGQMFAAIIEWEAAARFYPCTEYASPEISKFSPATIYKELGD